MATQDCESILNFIPLYIDNMLSDIENDNVREHIKSCPACKQEYAFLKSVLAGAKHLPKVQVSENFHASLMEKVRAEAGAKPVPKVKYNFRKAFTRFAAAAAVVAVSVVSYFSLNDNLHTDNPDVFIKEPVATETPATETPAVATDAPVATATAVPPVVETAEATPAVPVVEVTPARTPTPTAKPTERVPATPTPNAPVDEPVQPASNPVETTQPVQDDVNTPAVAAEPVVQEPDALEQKDASVAPTDEEDKSSAPAAQGGRAGGGSSGGGGGGGSAAAVQKDDTKGSVWYVFVSEEAYDAAVSVLENYRLEEEGYRVDEAADALLLSLSQLEGYKATEQKGATEATYIVLRKH